MRISLWEAISVTIIATGFDAHQQNDITNLEPKKVVHALEANQIIERDLTLKDQKATFLDTNEVESDASILYDLEAEAVEYTLEDSEQIMDLIPTTELLKAIEVETEEMIQLDLDEEFIINEVAEVESTTDSIPYEEQTSLTFDLPISNSKRSNLLEADVEVFKLEDLSLIHI